MLIFSDKFSDTINSLLSQKFIYCQQTRNGLAKFSSSSPFMLFFSCHHHQSRCRPAESDKIQEERVIMKGKIIRMQTWVSEWEAEFIKYIFLPSLLACAEMTWFVAIYHRRNYTHFEAFYFMRFLEYFYE